MNYYIRYSPCETCGRCSLERHIGKLSGGWRFLLQAHDDISSYEDWKEEFDRQGIKIFDEDGCEFPIDLMEDIIVESYGIAENKSRVGINPDVYEDSDGYELNSRNFS